MLAGALLLALTGRALPAAAHAELVAAEPPPGAELDSPPDEVRLTFNEALQPGSTFALFGEGFRRVEGVAGAPDPADPRQMAAALPELEPGTYTVQWTAVSGDGHTSEGSYSFSLRAGTAAGGAGWLAALLAAGLVAGFAASRLRRGGGDTS